LLHSILPVCPKEKTIIDLLNKIPIFCLRSHLLEVHGDGAQSDEICLFSFPEDAFIRALWGEKCGVIPSAESRICSLHFNDEDYENFHSKFLNNAPKRILKKDAVPSHNLPSNLLCGTVVILNQQLPTSASNALSQNGNI
jgi:hypothetical protein